jgi:hypothetical protein
MKRALIVMLVALVSGLSSTGLPVWTFPSPDEAKATEATIQKQNKKHVRTNLNHPQPKRKGYCGYPQEPNQAGMSEYCSFMYNIYCRRGVGCNQYGH